MTAAYLHGVEVIELATNSGTITTPATSIIGVVGTAQYADPIAFPLDTPVLVTNPTQTAALTATAPATPAAGATGTLPQAVADIYNQCSTPIVIVRVAQDVSDTGAAQVAGQMAEIVGELATQTGVYALVAAQALVGVKPKILIAPGYTNVVPAGATTSPAVAALLAVAYKLRAIVVVDGPNDTTAAATAMANLIGDQRIYMVDPGTMISNSAGAIVANPASAVVAGLIAANDQANGYWFSPSNNTLAGIVGTGRPIDFGLSDPTAESNILNAAGVATIVNSGGYRLWGNKSTSPIQAWQFLSVRRTFDVLEDAVQASYLWAMDRPMSVGLFTAVMAELNTFLRGLAAQGALLGGRAWLDPNLNTTATLQAGQFYVDFDGEPPAPLDRLTFQAQRNSSYYTQLLTAVAAAANATTTSTTSSTPGS